VRYLFTDTGQFSFYSQPKSHGAASIVEFMERAMAYSRSGQFLYFLRPNAPGLAPAPVQLLYPVSRLDSVPSLQHLCRFVIASRVRRDHIDFLPTPTSLKEYLKQTQYYAMTWLLYIWRRCLLYKDFHYCVQQLLCAFDTCYASIFEAHWVTLSFAKTKV